MDNYYTSPALFAVLKLPGHRACGTVRTNCRGIPLEIKQSNLDKGEVVVVDTEQDLMVLKWMDKRPVTMLSTHHNDSMVSKQRQTRHEPGGTEIIQKPAIVEQYNKFMGGVDKCDQLLSYYGFTHRTLKWWRRAFFHLLDVAVVNSYILYQLSHQSKHLTHEQYRIALAKELLCTSTSGVAHGRQPAQLPPSSRLHERHFPARTDETSGTPSQWHCVVCSNKKGRGRKTTTYKCKQCNVPMCVPCFELYHTKVDPQRYL